MGIVEIVGGSFTGLTVRRKVRVALSEPSLAVMLTVAVPNWSVAGERVMVRLEPLPPKEILLFGKRDGLEDEPVTIRLAAGV